MLNRLTLARPTAAPTANLALQRRQCDRTATAHCLFNTPHPAAGKVQTRLLLCAADDPEAFRRLWRAVVTDFAQCVSIDFSAEPPQCHQAWATGLPPTAAGYARLTAAVAEHARALGPPLPPPPPPGGSGARAEPMLGLNFGALLRCVFGERVDTAWKEEEGQAKEDWRRRPLPVKQAGTLAFSSFRTRITTCHPFRAETGPLFRTRITTCCCRRSHRLGTRRRTATSRSALGPVRPSPLPFGITTDCLLVLPFGITRD